MNIRTVIRNYIPLTFRQELKRCLRYTADFRSGISFDSNVGALVAEQAIKVVQPIMQSAFYENKVINITRGASLLNQNLIAPNGYWSFWQRIHRPSSSNGFLLGRNLINGELLAHTGGGLCQLSSMVYHLALLAGLTIVERHSHSIDIYEEDQRFTPLGADATVVWGFKDLRLYNPYPFAVSLQFIVKNGELIGELHADTHLKQRLVQFECEPLENKRIKVNTFVDGHIHATTSYERY